MNKREYGSCLIKTGAIRSKRESWRVAHFYRRIKNIFQFFGVELTLLLKTFG